MIQHNQIGKRHKKADMLNAKKGHTYVTPAGRQYQIVDWYKMGRIYHIIVLYKETRVNFKESDYNTFDLDECFNQIDISTSNG